LLYFLGKKHHVTVSTQAPRVLPNRQPAIDDLLRRNSGAVVVVVVVVIVVVVLVVLVVLVWLDEKVLNIFHGTRVRDPLDKHRAIDLGGLFSRPF
jgi:uncharacterized membrane protein YdbT with pleckstrin-like domain